MASEPLNFEARIYDRRGNLILEFDFHKPHADPVELAAAHVTHCASGEKGSGAAYYRRKGGVNWIPANRDADESDRLRKQINRETHEGDLGELRWSSNDAPVPMDCFVKARIASPAAQAEAIDLDTERVLDDYRARQANRSPEEIEEHAAELRANFEPGEVVVNVITGERTVV